MLGRNPLLVAKEHGHRMLTMLTVYTAWTEAPWKPMSSRSARRRATPAGNPLVTGSHRDYCRPINYGHGPARHWFAPVE